MKSEPNAPRVKLVVDTNTLVSGTLWSGLPSWLIEAVEHGHARPVIESNSMISRPLEA